MVNLETLTARSLRRYELGRLRMAARVSIVLLPLAAICLLERTGRETSVCCAVLLMLGSIWLRFRDRAGVESVNTGLLAGGIPLFALLLLTQIDAGCATAPAFSYCTAFSLLLGAAAGAVVAHRERTKASLSGNWLIVLSIALLTAGLGCARLGMASIAGVAVGLLSGRAAARHAPAKP
jgi:hypothetical protein